MRVFATDLDGVLASTSVEIENRIRKHFDLEGKPPKVYNGPWHLKYGVDQDELNEFLFSDECYNDPALWGQADPMDNNAHEMVKWCMAGLVPSIITARPPRMRLTTELWLSKYGVPYSNLLFGAGGVKAKMCYHIDADFMIEDNYSEAYEIAESGVRCYVYRTGYNKQYEEDLASLIEAGQLEPDKLIYVNTFKEITEMEKIG